MTPKPNATPNTIMQRDANGRAKVSAPVEADDIARRDTVDGIPIFTSRQAIINGGFNVAQRGASVTYTNNITVGNAYGYGLDRWIGQVYVGNGGSGNASFTMSQQTFIIGQTSVPGNPKHFARLSITSVGTKAPQAAFMRMMQPIESVSTFAGKKCSVSFWAKSNSNREIAVALVQSFGSGGNASAQVSCPGGKVINLTTSWQLFSVTFDVPSVAGKTLGTNNDDFLGLYFIPYKQDDQTVSIPSGEVGTYATGDFDFKEVCLCAGDVALTFQPRSFGEELQLCQRYYWKSWDLAMDAVGTQTGIAADTGGLVVTCRFPVNMRVSPTINIWSNNIKNRVRHTTANSYMPISGALFPAQNTKGFAIVTVSGSSFVANTIYDFDVEADAEL